MPTQEDDIHDDFKPKFKAEAEPRSAPSAVEQIKQDINSHDVFLFMKVCGWLLSSNAIPVDTRSRIVLSMNLHGITSGL